MSKTAAKTDEGMNITLLLNDDGDACLVHDQPFAKEPDWAEFDQALNTLCIYFADGEAYLVSDALAPDIRDRLAKSTELLLAEIKDNDIVGGHLLQLAVKA